MKERNIDNLKLTKKRKVVLQVIYGSNKHLTANEVFESSKKLLPSISFATVYNSLHFLKKEGHIAEIQFGNGASRFDCKTERHDHALCNKCGKLVDLELEIPEKLVKTASDYSKFKTDTIELILRGLCPKCAEA